MMKIDLIRNLTPVNFIRGLPEGKALTEAAYNGSIFSKFILRQIAILLDKNQAPIRAQKAIHKIAIRQMIASRGGPKFVDYWSCRKRLATSRERFRMLCKDLAFEIITAATFKEFNPVLYSDLGLSSRGFRLFLLKTMAKTAQELKGINPDATRNFKEIISNEALSIPPSTPSRKEWVEALKEIGEVA
jgi:hypothetical protein